VPAVPLIAGTRALSDVRRTIGDEREGGGMRTAPTTSRASTETSTGRGNGPDEAAASGAAESSTRWRTRLARWDLRFSPYFFVSPYFILFAIFGLYPLGYTFWVSLHDWALVGNHSWTGFSNYQELVGDEDFRNALFNTLGIFILATVPQLLLALVLAHILDKRLRTPLIWRMGVLLPNITSVAAVGIIFTLLFARDFGLVNWVLGHLGVDEPIAWQDHRWSSWIAISTMVDWRWTGYNALIFLAALQAVPKDLYEAAALDGASQFRQFVNVTVPMLRPTLIFVGIISTIGGLQLFTEPLLFNSGANAITGGTTRQFQTMSMYLVEQAFTRQQFGYAAAIAWVMFLLIGVVAAINIVMLRRIRSAE
jgi:cellobiose transport system permease protein